MSDVDKTQWPRYLFASSLLHGLEGFEDRFGGELHQFPTLANSCEVIITLFTVFSCCCGFNHLLALGSCSLRLNDSSVFALKGFRILVVVERIIMATRQMNLHPGTA